MRPVVDVVLGLPRAPRLDRVLDPRGDPAAAVGAGASRASGERPAQREARALARAPRVNAARMVASATSSGDRRRDADAARAAERPRAAVLERGTAAGRARTRAAARAPCTKLDLAADALDAAQQLVRRVVAEVVPALALGERHRVAAAATPPCPS